MTSSPFHTQKVTTPWNIRDVLRNRFRGKETQPLVIRDTSHPALLTWFLSRAPRWQRSPPLPECAHGSSSEPGRGRIHFFLDIEKKRRSRLVSRVKQRCHPCVCIWATTLSVSHINLSQRRRCKTLWRTTSLSKCVKMCVLFLIEKHCGRGGDNSFVCLNTLDTFSLTKTRRLNELCFVQITVTKDTVLISTSNLLIQGRFSFYKAFLSVKTVLPTPTG